MTATALDRTETPVWLRVGEIALAALVYFALARASLYFASLNASVTPIWPPTGLAIALLLLRGNVLLPAVAIGAFAANYAITPQIVTAGIIAIGNTLEAFIATFLVQRWAKGEHVFQSPIGVGKFAVIVTAGAAPISATVGVTALAATGHASWNDFVAIWITWWLGNLAGAILTTPALVLWGRTLRGEEPAPLAASALISFAGALLIAIIAFSPISPAPIAVRSALAFLVIMPLLWSALRLGLRVVEARRRLPGVDLVAGLAGVAGHEVRRALPGRHRSRLCLAAPILRLVRAGAVARRSLRRSFRIRLAQGSNRSV